MSSLSVNNKKFKGFFYYEFFDDDDCISVRPVSFEMSLVFVGNNFKGVRTDDETENLIKSPIKIIGFIEDDFISFLVDYPCNYYVDLDSGQTVLLENEKHPGVLYNGYYNKVNQRFEGNYEVQFNSKKEGVFQTDFLIDVITGDWEMEEI